MKRILLLIACMPIVFTGCMNTKNKNTQCDEKGVKMVREKTASGLEYTILKPGLGESPKAGQRVTVHYTGWLNAGDYEKGAKFDSSVDRGQPFGFVIGVGQVIKGWDEGVLAMKIGEQRRLFIPAVLGYGARGAGAVIPPNANLIFDVELIKIG
jgi:FKBP-type peptidyl-prolyl cis-trans isomerase